MYIREYIRFAGELLSVFCSNVPELQIFQEQANGSRDLTIAARHSPSRHETKDAEGRELNSRTGLVLHILINIL